MVDTLTGRGVPWGRRGILEWGGGLLAGGSTVLAVACGAGTSTAPASPTSAPP